MSPSSTRLKRFVLFAGPIFCLSLCTIQPASALFNCFTPNMFKMGKVGYPGQHPGERANWYPQMSLYAAQAYGHNPMSRLFKPKWMGGGLFGPKRWLDWRMQAAAANMNHLYRPNQAAAYWSQPSSFQYNQFADTLNTPLYPNAIQQPFPSMSTSGNPISSKLANGYYSNNNNNNNQLPISQSNINYNNEGWTYPSVLPRPNSQSDQLNAYGGDTYSVSPNSYQTNAKQQADQYGTKGGGGGSGPNKTSKKVLVADGI